MADSDSGGRTDAYRVSIKRSARRTNAAAAEWVAQEGSVRTFDSKATARAWAERISTDSQGAVRIQDAVPHDRAEIDGYLVADPIHRRRMGKRTTDKTDEATRSLEAFGTDETDESDYVQTQF